MAAGIYLIENNANGKFYVGSTDDFTERWCCHRSHLKSGIHRNPPLQAAWKKYGSQAFVFQVVELCKQAELIEREHWWMGLLQARDRGHGYNLLSADRRSHSPETCARMSRSQKGRVHSPEHRAKIGAAHRGMKRSPEACANISASKKGRPSHRKGVAMSEETKAKLRAANLGKKYSEETRQKVAAAGTGRSPTWETRQRIAASLRGRCVSAESRARMSASAQTRRQTG